MQLIAKRAKQQFCFLVSMSAILSGCADPTPDGRSDSELAKNRISTNEQKKQLQSEQEMGEVLPLRSKKGWVKKRSKWGSPNIEVCWEDRDPQHSDERDLVRAALKASWEAYSIVKFSGWKQCARRSSGVRVIVEDSGARTLGIGKELNGLRRGLLLNFDFGNWNRWCNRDKATREKCIRANAVHEFGHALGFVHEQNRHDTPSSCTASRQGSDGDLILTPWDSASIMNYCNTERMLNGGKLSSGDIKSIKEFYGEQTI